MRFLGWNMLLSAWLLVSAFVLPHSPTSLALTAIAAGLLLLIAALSARAPAIRYANVALALALAGGALLGDTPAAAAIHNGIFAAVLLALSLVSPLHAAPEQAPAAKAGG